MIEVRNLTKKYGANTVVNHLSFTIEKGKIYGFLGPNGAGKSTTMNMITGCLPMTSGEVRINGHDVFKEPVAAKKCVGYLPEIPPLYPDLTPEEYLTFVARAKGIAKGNVIEAVNAAMTETNITGMKNRLIRNLSKGYRQRVGIAQAMLGEPELIILDEPTVGLDPRQIIEIRDLICKLGATRTIILSSHILAEVSAVCDHVLILSHGNLVASDTLENLRHHYDDESTLTLLVRAPSGKIEAAVSGIANILSYEITGMSGRMNQVVLHIKKNADIREAVFNAFSAAKLPILEMTSSAPSLEDVFIRLTSDEYAIEHNLIPSPEEIAEEEPVSGDEEEPEDDEDEDSDEDDDDDEDEDDQGAGKKEGYVSMFATHRDDDDDDDEDEDDGKKPGRKKV